MYECHCPSTQKQPGLLALGFRVGTSPPIFTSGAYQSKSDLTYTSKNVPVLGLFEMNPLWLGLYGIFVKHCFSHNEHLPLHKSSILVQQPICTKVSETIKSKRLNIFINIYEYLPGLILVTKSKPYADFHSFLYLTPTCCFRTEIGISSYGNVA